MKRNTHLVVLGLLSGNYCFAMSDNTWPALAREECVNDPLYRRYAYGLQYRKNDAFLEITPVGEQGYLKWRKQVVTIIYAGGQPTLAHMQTALRHSDIPLMRIITLNLK